jgi:hypothetical protein
LNYEILVACLVTQAMEVNHKAGPVFELVTWIEGYMSCQKLSNQNEIHYENLAMFFINVRFSPMLKLNNFGTPMGKTDAK